MGMPSFDHHYNNPLGSAVSSTGNSVSGGINPAPTSIPPDLGAMQQPPMPVSVLDSSEPKMFPGIIAKSRQGSVTNRRVSVDQTDGEDRIHEAMSQSILSLGRIKSDGGASGAITEEEDASEESE